LNDSPSSVPVPGTPEFEILLAKLGGSRANSFGIEGRYVPGGSIQYDAPDLASAVALAEEFKAAGHYKFFRGQRDARWKIVSSFVRLAPEQREQAIADFSEFLAFARGAPDLLAYLQDDDALIATAQHHGLAATNFIDFSHSPQVAGWFASDGAVIGEEGAIFLVDDEAENGFALTGGKLRFIAPSVPNLWRLEAQQGFFLEAPGPFDHIWPLDRIVFPHGDAISPIPRGHIYPIKKSALEQAIDQYELKRRQLRTFQEFMASADHSRMRFIQIEDDTLNDEGDPLIAPPEWATGPHERWTDMDIESKGEPIAIELMRTVSEELVRLIGERRHCAELLEITGAVPSTLQMKIDRLWRGCRPHPYSSNQIARCIVSLVSMVEALENFRISEGLQQQAAADMLYSPAIEIEMSTAGENAARAFVNVDRLWSALKPEIRSSLAPEGRPFTGGWISTLFADNWKRPGRNFQGPMLLELFVDQIIPWQIATNRHTIAFSAFHIRTLGKP
jgi:FRG domain